MKKIISYLMLVIGVVAVALTSCKQPEEEVIPDYELGTPTLEMSLAETTQYSAEFDLTMNKVTRLVYYLIEEASEDFVAPTAAKVKSEGIKESVKESSKLNITLDCHKTYKISFIGQGLDAEEKKVYTDVITFDVVTPADIRLMFVTTPAKSQLTIKMFPNDVEKVYYKLVLATEPAPTEEDLLKETPLDSIYDTDEELGDFFRTIIKQLTAETRYNFYAIGVSYDESKSELYILELETKSDTSVSLTTPTTTATTATLAITNSGNTDVIKACLYDVH